MINKINECAALFESYLTDFLKNPMKYGINISYFILSAGAALWLILFAANFVRTILGF